MSDFLCVAAQEHLQKIVDGVRAHGFNVSMYASGEVIVSPKGTAALPPEPVGTPKAPREPKEKPVLTAGLSQKCNRCAGALRSDNRSGICAKCRTKKA